MVLARREVPKDAGLLVLRHENTVLRRQIGRVRYQRANRLWLSALSRLTPRRRWGEVFTVTPATLLAWHRRLVARKWDYSGRRRPGRPSTAAAIHKLVVRMAIDNPAWGAPARAGRARQARPPDRCFHGVADPACRGDRSCAPPHGPDRRVAPVHCCTGTPQDRACHSSRHAAQASRLGGSGRLLQHGVSRQPGRMFRPVAGGVYEVCPVTGPSWAGSTATSWRKELPGPPSCLGLPSAGLSSTIVRHSKVWRKPDGPQTPPPPAARHRSAGSRASVGPRT